MRDKYKGPIQVKIQSKIGHIQSNDQPHSHVGVVEATNNTKE